MTDLLQAGVRIYEYEHGMHAKMLIVDGQVTMIGSANLDVRSFGYDFEANVNIYSDSFARRAESVFLSDLGSIREILPSDYLERPVTMVFVENFFRLISPFA